MKIRETRKEFTGKYVFYFINIVLNTNLCLFISNLGFVIGSYTFGRISSIQQTLKLDVLLGAGTPVSCNKLVE